jgi:hypothetical protein
VRAADDGGVSRSSALRRTLAVASAAAVAASVSAPGAGAKPRPTHVRSAAKVCAVKSGSLRPSPLRACRKASKAPRALPR